MRITLRVIFRLSWKDEKAFFDKIHYNSCNMKVVKRASALSWIAWWQSELQRGGRPSRPNWVHLSRVGN